MLDAAIKTISNLDRDDVEKTVRSVMDGLPDIDFSEQAKKALAIVAASGISAEAIRDAGGTAVRRTGEFVASHPRRVGGGLGVAALVGIGAFMLIKKLKTPEELEVQQKLLAAPEEA